MLRADGEEVLYEIRISPLLRDRCAPRPGNGDRFGSGGKNRCEGQEAGISNLHTQLASVTGLAASLPGHRGSDGIPGAVLAAGVEHSGGLGGEDAAGESAACQSV